MSARRVLVTGSSGLVGTPLVGALRGESVETHGVSRTSTNDPLTHHADLACAEQASDLLARVRPTVIVHLAGGRDENVDRLYESNVLTTVNLVQAAAQLDPPPAFITAGSAAEYGEPPGAVVSESDHAQPITDYGRAKLASSLLAQSVSARSGMAVCVVRPFNIVSPAQTSGSALGNMRRQLLAQTGKERLVRCGRLDIIRDFVTLEFVVDVFSMLIRAERMPPVLNVCSGIGIELGAILHAMGCHLDVEIDVITVPQLAVIPAADRIVGDPAALHRLGMSCEPTASSLAEFLVGESR